MIYTPEGLYEFAVEGDTVQFINFYEIGSTIPLEIDASRVPEEVWTKLLAKI